MWPDDPFEDGLLPSVGAGDVPADADLLALDAELTAAGTRARRRSPAAPTPAFAAVLRERLLASSAGLGGGTVDAAAGGSVAVPMARPASMPTTSVATATVTGTAAGTAAAAGMSAPAAGSSSSRARGADDERIRALPVGSVTHRPAPVVPRVTRRTPTVLPAPRWSILAVAAAVVLAVAGLGSDLLRAAPPVSRASAAVGAQLVRGGATIELTAGQAVAAGDEILVAAGGSATIQLGPSRIRLAGGADLAIVRLEPTRIELDQRAGRAWHRVNVPSGGQYVVTTGAVSWTAAGTAFDIDRGRAGGNVVQELSVQHGVVAEGPGLRVTVDEGRGATVVLGAAPTVETMAVPAATAAADPWIRSNAAADVGAGDTVGMLDGLDLGVAATSTAPAMPSASPSLEPAASPSPTAAATAEPTSSPTPRPTSSPTPKPTVRPTPKPTPAPTFGSMALAALACPGGVVLDWTVPDIASIAKVRVLRGTSAEIPADGSMPAGVTVADGGSTGNLAVTDGFSTTGADGTAWYRAIAFTSGGAAVAASGVRAATTQGIADLGTLGVSGGGPQTLVASWAAFAGAGDCFNYYKLVASADDPTPSYLEGSQYLAAISDQGATGTTVTVDAASGSMLYVRLQAIRATSLGKFIVAQTAPVQVTVP